MDNKSKFLKNILTTSALGLFAATIASSSAFAVAAPGTKVTIGALATETLLGTNFQPAAGGGGPIPVVDGDTLQIGHAVNPLLLNGTIANPPTGLLNWVGSIEYTAAPVNLTVQHATANTPMYVGSIATMVGIAPVPLEFVGSVQNLTLVGTGGTNGTARNNYSGVNGYSLVAASTGSTFAVDTGALGTVPAGARGNGAVTNLGNFITAAAAVGQIANVNLVTDTITSAATDVHHLLGVEAVTTVQAGATYTHNIPLGTAAQTYHDATMVGTGAIVVDARLVAANTALTLDNAGAAVFKASADGLGNLQIKAPTGGASTLTIAATAAGDTIGIPGKRIGSVEIGVAEAGTTIAANADINAVAMVQNRLGTGAGTGATRVTYNNVVNNTGAGSSFTFAGAASAAINTKLQGTGPATIDYGVTQNNTYDYGPATAVRALAPTIRGAGAAKGGLYLQAGNFAQSLTTDPAGVSPKVVGIDTSAGGGVAGAITIGGRDYNVMPGGVAGGLDVLTFGANPATIILGDNAKNIHIDDDQQAATDDPIHTVARGSTYAAAVNKARFDLTAAGLASKIKAGSAAYSLLGSIGSTSTDVTKPMDAEVYFDATQPNDAISAAGADLNLAFKNSTALTTRPLVYTGNATVTQTDDSNVFYNGIKTNAAGNGKIAMGSKVGKDKVLNIRGAVTDVAGVNSMQGGEIDAGNANLTTNFTPDPVTGKVSMKSVTVGLANPDAIHTLTGTAEHNFAQYVHADQGGVLNVIGNASIGEVAANISDQISSEKKRFKQVIFDSTQVAAGGVAAPSLTLKKGQQVWSTKDMTTVTANTGTLITDGDGTGFAAPNIGSAALPFAGIVASNTANPTAINNSFYGAIGGVFVDKTNGNIAPAAKTVIHLNAPLVQAARAVGAGKIALDADGMILDVAGLGDGAGTAGSLGGVQIMGGGAYQLAGTLTAEVAALEFGDKQSDVTLTSVADHVLPIVTTTSKNGDQNIVTNSRVDVNNPVGTDANRFGMLKTNGEKGVVALNDVNYKAGVGTTKTNTGQAIINAAVVGVPVGAPDLVMNVTKITTTGSVLSTLGSTTTNVDAGMSTTVKGGSVTGNEVIFDKTATAADGTGINFTDTQLNLAKITALNAGTGNVNFSGTTNNTAGQDIELGTNANKLAVVNFAKDSITSLQGDVNAESLIHGTGTTIIGTDELIFNATDGQTATNYVVPIGGIYFQGKHTAINPLNILAAFDGTNLGEIGLTGAGSILDTTATTVNYQLSAPNNLVITKDMILNAFTLSNKATADGLKLGAINYTPLNDLFFSDSFDPKSGTITLKNTARKGITDALKNMTGLPSRVTDVAGDMVDNYADLGTPSKLLMDQTVALIRAGKSDVAAEMLDRTFSASDSSAFLQDIPHLITGPINHHGTTFTSSRFGCSNTQQALTAAGDGVAAGDLAQFQNRFSAFIQPIYSKGKYKKGKDVPGYTTNSAGVLVGVQSQVNDDLEATIFGGYLGSKVKYKDRLSGNKANIASYTGGVQFVQNFTSEYFMKARGSVTSYTMKNKSKQIGYVNNQVVSGLASSKGNGIDWNLDLGGGARYAIADSAMAAPFAGVELNYNNLGSLSETGLYGPSRTIQQKSKMTPKVYAGVSFSGAIPTGAGDDSPILTPSAQVTVFHSFNKRTTQEIRLDGYSKSIPVKSGLAGRTGGDLQLALTTQLPMADVTIGTNYTVAKKAQAMAGWLQLKVQPF